MKNICNYHTKQNKINKTTKTKLKTTLLLKLLFVIVVVLVAVVLMLFRTKTNKHMQNICKHYIKQNKNQQNNIHIHIIVIIYSCLFYWLQNCKNEFIIIKATLEPLFFGSKVAKIFYNNKCKFRANIKMRINLILLLAPNLQKYFIIINASLEPN